MWPGSRNGADRDPDPDSGLALNLTLTLTLNAAVPVTLKEYDHMNDPSASGKHDFMHRTALWELSQCFSGGMGWVAALYLMMTSLAPRTTASSKVPLFGARHVAPPEVHPLAQGYWQLLVPRGEPPPCFAARRAPFNHPRHDLDDRYR